MALFDRAERIRRVGSWEWSPQTGELLWSDNLFRLYGREPGSFVPTPESILAQVHPEDQERLRDVGSRLAAGQDVGTVEYRVVRPDGHVRQLFAVLGIVDASDDVARCVVGSTQDVTEERRGDRRLRAYAAVSAAIDEWDEFEVGAKRLLAELAGALELSFGALWIPGREMLSTKAVWHPPDSEALAAVAQATVDWQPGPGAPTLGRAWIGRQPVAAPNPWIGSPPERAAAIREAGLTAIVVIPAVMMAETLAILEFLSEEPVEPNAQLMRALTGIGHEIGYFLAQHRGALVEPVLTRREVEVLQLAARGHTAAEIAAELFLSLATVKRHFEGAYAGLGVSDRASAVAAAMRQGSIT